MITLDVRVIPRARKTECAGFRDDALVIRVAAPPVEGAANEAVIEFLRYVLSRQGQQAVKQEGNYLPLPDEIALRQLRQLPTSSNSP